MADYDRALERHHQDLNELEGRWREVKAAWDQEPGLREAIATADRPRQAELRRELRRELAELELTLESRLISGFTVRLTIWNILRFGSLGFLLGWWLHR